MKKTCKREFLDEMERVVPWKALVQIIEPYWPKNKTGRPPFAVETMLRVHYLQHWIGLSDPAMEEAMHDVPLHLEFAGLSSGASCIPDETTILRFRHLLEKHNLAADMLRVVNDILEAKGLLMRTGTAVDAALISVVLRLAWIPDSGRWGRAAIPYCAVMSPRIVLRLRPCSPDLPSSQCDILLASM